MCLSLINPSRRARANTHRYRGAIAADARHADALCNLGALLAARNDLDGAQDAFTAAAAAAPESSGAHANLGRLLAQRGELSQAEVRTLRGVRSRDLRARVTTFNVSQAALRRAVRADERCPDARSALGALLYANGNKDDAVLEWRRALELNPAHAEARFHSGVANADAGDLGAAERDLRAALRSNPMMFEASAVLERVMKARAP